MLRSVSVAIKRTDVQLTLLLLPVCLNVTVPFAVYSDRLALNL